MTWYDAGPGNEEIQRLIDEHDARERAHAAFDTIWLNAQVGKGRARRICYAWLAFCLGIPREQAHMAQFDVETCERVVQICAGVRWGDVLEWYMRSRVESRPHKEV